MGLKDYGFFKKDSKRTPREKAQKAKLGITARLLGCAYLVYIAIKLLKMTAAGEASVNTNVAYGIAILILVFGAVVIGFTVAEFVRKLKDGDYKTLNYYKDEFGDNFSQEDMAALEEQMDKNKEIEKRRSNSKDSFAEREELDKLLYLEHLKQEQEKLKNAEDEDEPEQIDNSSEDEDDTEDEE